ncbi:MAG TPA: S41 family peptidase [Chthonomonadaceae bacterium]|nr:S41 family peptidase [Chthonomonadaceae bacterium]
MKWGRRSFVTVIVAAVCLVSGAAAALADRGERQDPQPPAAQPSGEGYRANFEQVWRTVRDRFHDPNLNGVNWAKIAETFRAKLPDIKTKAEFEAFINRMLAELHASHTGYSTDDDVEFYMLPSVMRQDMTGHRTEHIGVMGAQEGDEFVVAAVLDGGPAEVAGLQSGDRIVSADGTPFRTAGSFRGKDGRPVAVAFRRGRDVAVHTVMVIPVRQNILQAYLDATEKSARIISVSGKRIGYIHLWTMANDAFRTTLERVLERRLHDTDGLILDLRDGYGGSPWNYADVFFRPDVSWEQQSRSGGGATRYTGYGKPMVVLINQGTRSAKEFLSYELKTKHRATLVGTRTAGAFLGAGAFEIGRDGLLELPILGLKVDGQLLEGNGVAPDVNVPARNSYTDRDAQVLAGEQALAEMTKVRAQAPAGRHAAL